MSKPQSNLPTEIAEIFDELNQHIYWLHANWLIFEQLFASDKERVDLMNDFAPIFFRLCQDSFHDNVILYISRLTDPLKSAGKDTLSIERLVTTIDSIKYQNLRNTIEQQFSTLKILCKPIKDIRNRKPAHNDFDLAFNLGSNSLPNICKKDVDNILKHIRELMTSVWIYFNPDCELSYEVIMTNDGEAVIRALEKAKKYSDIRRNQYQQIKRSSHNE
jgi:hypothetical protein